MISKNSIAVLPFVNMSSDKQNEYFSDGITEEILNTLSKFEELHVTSRTSSFVFKNKNIDVREIGKKLNVAYVLEGSIRRADDVVRITANLLKADDGFHIWSESWDRELKNIFILQDEIAGFIAEKVNEKVNVPARTNSYVVENTDAIDFYLKGLYILNSYDYKRTDAIISNFKKSIAIDPNFTKGYIGLCHAYTWMGSIGLVSASDAQEQVDYYLEKVQQLDKNIPDIYLVNAGRNFWFEWNLAMALENVNRALLLKPSYFDALMFKGLILAASGRIEEALDTLFQAERLNPCAETINYVIGLVYNLTNDNDKALGYIEKNEAIFTGWYAQYLAKVEVLCKLQRFDDAWEVIAMLENDPNCPLSIPQLKGMYYAIMGKKAEALKYAELAKKLLDAGSLMNAPDAYYLGYIYLKTGDLSTALDYLENGIHKGATPFLFIQIDNTWDELHDHPRFKKAVEKIVIAANNDNQPHRQAKYKKTSLSKEQVSNLNNSITRIMEIQKPYFNPRLSLSDLAELTDVTTNQLSQFLNDHKQKNFYDFVNQYRLKKFLEYKQNRKYANFTILGLAYECGFNSKTTFNAFFKKTMGATPSDYFKQSITD